MVRHVFGRSPVVHGGAYRAGTLAAVLVAHAALPALIALAFGLWCAGCLVVAHRVAPWLAARCGGDPITGIMAEVVRVYCRLVHRVRFEHASTETAALAERTHPGPLVVVSNHTAGIDPLLIQSGLHAHVRWMMERAMMVPALDWLWRHQRMIPVDFDAGDASAARAAVAHVRNGGVLGIFPEGGLARPPEHVLPFLPGVGLVVARTGAPVLLCWVSGTPRRRRSLQSLAACSRSRVVFVDVVRYPPRARPTEIAEDLRRRLVDASGWPAHDRAPQTGP